jgi:DNA-binding CsgD family transcriptional regulator
VTVIRVARVRAAMRLVGEVYELGVRTEAGRCHLMRELLTLLGAEVGGTVHDRGYSPGMSRGIIAATLGGFDSRVTDVFDAHQNMGSAINPFHRAVMARAQSIPRGELFTSTNAEIVERSAWERSVWINEYVRPARVDHFMASIRYIGETASLGCGVMRAAGSRPFTDEDREVLHLVSLGIGPTYDPASIRLAPRVREVLDILMTGASDKEIAHRMRLSTHTVRQYVKMIYRAYGVSSRAQLIARATPRTA